MGEGKAIPKEVYVCGGRKAIRSCGREWKDAKEYIRRGREREGEKEKDVKE